MSNSLKQSMKERLRSVAKTRDLTFDEIWHNLILERFLARLIYQSGDDLALAVDALLTNGILREEDTGRSI